MCPTHRHLSIGVKLFRLTEPLLSFVALCLAAGCVFFCSPALALSADERKAFLDAIRPHAEKRAGQPVRFKVGTLNVDGDWALLVGELRGPSGRPIDWSLAPGCNSDLDKGLWVVARRRAQIWQIREMEICMPEPVWWAYDERSVLGKPCGIYANLWFVPAYSETPTGLDQWCRRVQARLRKTPR